MAWDDISDLTWLQPRETPGQALAQGVQAGSAIVSNWMRGRAMRMQREQFEAELPVRIAAEQARAAYQQSVAAGNMIKIKAMEDKATDAPLLASTVLAMNEAGKVGGADGVMAFEPPTFALPETYKMFTTTQLKLASDLRNSADAKEFEKRLLKVDPAARAAIREIRNPAAKWQALSLAEERAGVAKENELAQAHVDALERGDVPTTTISGDKVSTRYAPKKPGEGVASEPQTKALSDGTVLAWMPGGKGIHTIKGQQKTELTPSQLLSIARETIGPDKQVILDALKSMATNQIAKPTEQAAPAAKSPNPQFTKGERVKQNGVVYEFDGKDFVPVNQ